MKIAVVWNCRDGEVVNCFGRPCPETYSLTAVERVARGLRNGGHAVELFEGDTGLLERLRSFFPPAADLQAPQGMVFNMAYGIQGDCRYTHVPAMLEMAGVPYTGSNPMGHALALDKAVTKTLIESAGVPTPKWTVADRPDHDPVDLGFPLVVKPRHESTSFGLRIAQNKKDLEDAVLEVLTQYDQEALLEEYVAGREVCVGLLGNGPAECLPLVELDFGERTMSACTWEDKMHRSPDELQKHCPANLPDSLRAKLREIAISTFRACHCRDYARVDIRMDSSGVPYVLEINSMASLGIGGSYVMAAASAGYDFSKLVCRIVDVAHQRYFGTPISQDTRESAGTASTPAVSVSAMPALESASGDYSAN